MWRVKTDVELEAEHWELYVTKTATYRVSPTYPSLMIDVDTCGRYVKTEDLANYHASLLVQEQLAPNTSEIDRIYKEMGSVFASHECLPVNVGFTSLKLVCKTCDKEMN